MFLFLLWPEMRARCCFLNLDNDDNDDHDYVIASMLAMINIALKTSQNLRRKKLLKLIENVSACEEEEK